MALDLTQEDPQVLAEAAERDFSRLEPRTRNADLIAGLVLLAATAGLWLVQPPSHIDLLPAMLSLLVFVVAQRVTFATPLGYTSAAQLALVPLLFALPPALVPPAAMLSFMIAGIPEVVRGEISPLRLLRAIPNVWFAFGPAALLAFTGTTAFEAGPLLLLRCLGAQFLSDFLAWYWRSWMAGMASFRAQINELWLYLVDFALSIIGLLVAEDLHAMPVVALAPLPLLGLLGLFAHQRKNHMESLLELNTAYHGTALVLGDVVEADDGYTGEHCRMVVGLALAVGREMGLNSSQLRDLEFGAMLHDVGKITVPKEIINKPGKLTAEEWVTMKTHTTEGQKMLDQVGGFMGKVGLIVRSHHERWDGGGYPDGLVGEHIPLAARIVTCCDSWNAMRTDRSYRKALPYDVALGELIAHTGTQFDPNVIEAFVRVIRSEADEAAALSRIAPADAPVDLSQAA